MSGTHAGLQPSPASGGSLSLGACVRLPMKNLCFLHGDLVGDLGGDLAGWYTVFSGICCGCVRRLSSSLGTATSHMEASHSRPPPNTPGPCSASRPLEKGARCLTIDLWTAECRPMEGFRLQVGLL